MDVVAARVAVWVFTAFWFWLVLARIFSRLRVPYPAIVAAGAGLDGRRPLRRVGASP